MFGIGIFQLSAGSLEFISVGFLQNLQWFMGYKFISVKKEDILSKNLPKLR